MKFLLLIPGSSRISTICEKYWHLNTTFKAMCTVTLHHCQRKTCWNNTSPLKRLLTSPHCTYSKSYDTITNDVSNIWFTSSYYHNTFIKKIGTNMFGNVLFSEHLVELKVNILPSHRLHFSILRKCSLTVFLCLKQRLILLLETSPCGYK